MAKIDHSKRKRMDDWQQARRDKALELASESSNLVREAEMADKSPATPAQMALIIKHEMMDLDQVSYISKAKARSVIDAWAKAHNWKQKGEYKKKPKKKANKKKTSTYGACYSSDIKVTNIKTGEVRIDKNPVRLHSNAKFDQAKLPEQRPTT